MKKVYFLFLLLIAIMVNSGCDGGIGFEGKVYKLENKNAGSIAYIDGSLPTIENLEPMENARVTLYHVDKKSNNLKDMIVLGNSDKNGYFSVGAIVAPFEFDVLLIAEKPGYKTVKKRFTHSKIDHKSIILLAPIDEKEGISR